MAFIWYKVYRSGIFLGRKTAISALEGTCDKSFVTQEWCHVTTTTQRVTFVDVHRTLIPICLGDKTLLFILK